nr:RecName: Full=Serine protease inhibitor dipetalogastin; Short=Dipetalin; Flags: Precursor [Dipetalogaster maximus]
LIKELVNMVIQHAEEEEVKELKNPCECPRALHRVCGSDGNTYSNPCMLNCAKHEGNPDLVQVHKGPCDEHDHDFEDPCKCDNKFEPVCGDDQITYLNLCHLECATFTTSPGVEVAYEGECHAETTNAMEVLFQGNPCECPRALHRVCGSDGNTYSNPCMLTCAKHEGNPDLVQVHEGPCDEHDHDFEDTCQCDDTFQPVCGDDEITYRNLCHLECATFTTSPGVEVKHEGECHPETKVNQLILKSCMCPKIYKPVCGTDGRTYPNICVLKCHISSNPGLGLAHLGECKVAVLAKETGEVRNPCNCFRNFNPVCGTDGKTYGNLCMLGCAAETKVPGLKLLHNGRCLPKEQL